MEEIPEMFFAEETFASTRLDEAEMTIHTCCRANGGW
jgi:hypothetical protein